MPWLEVSLERQSQRAEWAIHEVSGLGMITSHDGWENVKNHCEKELDFSGCIV